MAYNNVLNNETRKYKKMTNIENTYKSYQSKVEDLVDTNLQGVLDTKHECNNEIRSLAASCKNEIGGSTATNEVNVEQKLQKLSEKHAQQIAKITDEKYIIMKAIMQDTSSKYDIYSQSMSQQKREVEALI